MRIEGSSAVITGGAGGLGRAVATRLHERGCRVVLFDRDLDRAEAFAKELGGRAAACGGDASSPEDTTRAIELAAAVAPLRAVVATAGGASRSRRVLDREGNPHELDLFRETFELNTVSAFNTLRLAAQAMAGNEPDEDGGRGAIVLTASVAAFEGQIGQSAYAAAKAAIVGLTIVAARDLAACGIRVNTIAPGIMGTPAWDGSPPGVRERLEAKVPFPKRLGHPEEFAAAAEHLITNGYINAHTLRLDGGIRFDPA